MLKKMRFKPIRRTGPKGWNEIPHCITEDELYAYVDRQRRQTAADAAAMASRPDAMASRPDAMASRPDAMASRPDAGGMPSLSGLQLGERILRLNPFPWTPAWTAAPRPSYQPSERQPSERQPSERPEPSERDPWQAAPGVYCAEDPPNNL